MSDRLEGIFLSSQKSTKKDCILLQLFNNIKILINKLFVKILATNQFLGPLPVFLYTV